MSRSGGVPDPGAWPSPVSAQLVVSGSVGLGEVRCAEVDVVWSELRPEEGGRVQLVAHHPDGRRSDLLPDGFSARTRVHEYGGGAWWLHDDTVFFANFEDQRLWRLDPGARPEPLTPPPAQPGGDRYADGCVTPDGLWIVCVRERHDPTGDEPSGEPSNELVAIPAHGGEPRVLVGGRDFVAAPRLSPDGSSLAWLA